MRWWEDDENDQWLYRGICLIHVVKLRINNLYFEREAYVIVIVNVWMIKKS